MPRTDERHPAQDKRYAGISGLPATESLATTLERVLPCWEALIAPDLRNGKNVLIAAHGNSLRALVKMLDDVSADEITGFNIPTGIPLVYELGDDLKPLSHEFLGDPDTGCCCRRRGCKSGEGRLIYSLQDRVPVLEGDGHFIADNATIAGTVRLKANAKCLV